MQIRAGFRIAYECPRPTPMLLTLSVHPSRSADLLTPHTIHYEPVIEARDYRDTFGNIVTRILAPTGRITVSSDFIVNDSGLPDIVEPDAEQLPVEDLPDDVIVYLMGSRYCDTDRLMHTAWSLFGNAPPGWGRVQAICDYVNAHLTFGYQHASVTRTALDGYNERRGVCRDFAHLAVTLCRCMNIPARYCTGYLGDIGIPALPFPMDYNAWFEAYLGGRWYTFDARHNKPRIGRILVARGRDAADVAISTIFGPASLAEFTVITDEVASTAS